MATYRLIVSALIFALTSAAAQADVFEIFTEEIDEVDVFNATVDLGDGENPYGVQVVAAADSPFGDGNALQMIDLYDGDKPELQGELAAPLLEPFRIDFQSFDQSPADSSSAIRFRMANSGNSISSESRSAFSLSWQADGALTAKYQGNADENASDVDTKKSAILEGVHDVALIANGGITDAWTYNSFGIERTLNPQSYDVYINGELLNSSEEGDNSHDDFKNGMAFHTLKSMENYDPSAGIQRFGLIGSSNSNTDPDYLFDNIILTTGADISMVPEPNASLLLVFGLVAVLGLRRSNG